MQIINIKSHLEIIKDVDIIKTIKISVLCIVLTFSFSFVANANYTSEEFQQSFFKIGYKGIYEALDENNKHFKQSIALPVQLPSITFTHGFGRFSNLDGESNDKLEINYLNKDVPQNHYKIFVQPVKYGLEFREDLIDQRLKTKDGNEALYSTKAVRDFNLLVFKKNEFQYILSVDKRISDKVTPELLVEIADSIS
ncbi:hypothetical protein ACN6MT_19705 [Neobacillus niacini]|uniref:hypothetical protein n=1 Tax=Neobacillus niacini TaxID=86668 RepID=UPI003B016EE5